MAERSGDWMRQAEADLRHAVHARDDEDYDDAWVHTLSLLLGSFPENARPDAALLTRAEPASSGR